MDTNQSILAGIIFERNVATIELQTLDAHTKAAGVLAVQYRMPGFNPRQRSSM